MVNNDVNPKVDKEFNEIINSFNTFKHLIYLAEFYPNEESRSQLFNKLYELEHIIQQNYTDIIKGVKKEIYDSIYYDKTICSNCKHDLDQHNHIYNDEKDFNVIKCLEVGCLCKLSYNQVLVDNHETIRVGKEIDTK